MEDNKFRSVIILEVGGGQVGGHVEEVIQEVALGVVRVEISRSSCWMLSRSVSCDKN